MQSEISAMRICLVVSLDRKALQEHTGCAMSWVTAVNLRVL